MAAKIKVNFKRPKPLEQIASASSTPFANFSSVVDVSGKLHFSGKASVDNEGITFQNGTSYKVKIEDFEQEGVLGRGQFGIVQKVVYKPTKVVMALKEIRLELDQNKLNHIIMELDVLHKSDHPNIIKFYGAFTVENCVYIALENMDAGSLDILYKGGVEEAVLAKIGIFERLMLADVKPTNILADSCGNIKLCDIGVSGHLIQSMAKTNVGCQPYLAPERIKRDAVTYSSRSDVWSLGLSLVEIGTGTYPYASILKDSVFAQLSAIVNGIAPALPKDRYSDMAHEFILACLNKDPMLRPAYPDLLNMPWIMHNRTVQVDMKEWVLAAVARRDSVAADKM